MTDDLIKRLRALVVAVHDDLSVGDEAADEIERLRAENAALAEDARRLDSGCIRLVNRDEFGESIGTVYAQVDLRVAIDWAIEMTQPLPDMAGRIASSESKLGLAVFTAVQMREYGLACAKAASDDVIERLRGWFEQNDKIERLTTQNAALRAEINRLCPSSWNETALVEELRRQSCMVREELERKK